MPSATATPASCRNTWKRILTGILGELSFQMRVVVITAHAAFHYLSPPKPPLTQSLNLEIIGLLQ